MNHPSHQALLEWEDAPEKDSALGSHLAQCASCSEELGGLRRRRALLQGLPSLSAPGGTWKKLERRASSSLKRRRSFKSAALAAAACALAVAGWAALARRAPPATLASIDDAASIAPLVQRSQALEEELGGLPEPPVVEVEDADARAEFEDGISWVDRCLAELDPAAPAGERAALWKTRINLLQSLLDLRRPPAVLVSL